MFSFSFADILLASHSRIGVGSLSAGPVRFATPTLLTVGGLDDIMVLLGGSLNFCYSLDSLELEPLLHGVDSAICAGGGGGLNSTGGLVG